MLTHRLQLTLLASCVLLSSCGGGGGDDPAAAPVATQLELLAGHIGGPGNFDGVGSAARFNDPQAAVRAPSGEIYVSDTRNNLIRRIDTDGKVSIWAGVLPNSSTNIGGNVDGNRLSAQFKSPRDIAIGKDGTLYVADRGNAVIRTISPAGVVGTLQVRAPSTGGSGAGAGNTATTSITAERLVSEPSGGLFIAGPDLTLSTISPQGEIRTVPAIFPVNVQSITGIGVDRSGRRLVAGRRSGSIGAALYRLADDGTFTWLAGDPWTSGTTDGDRTSARFGTITSVVEDANGDLIIADDLATIAGFGRTVVAGGRTIRKLSPNGVVSTLAGRGKESGSTDGNSSSNLLCGPQFVSPYDATRWLVADSCNHVIRLLGSNGQLETLAGLAPTMANTNGTGGQARFNQPKGIATTQDGSAYVADHRNSSIRRISADGQTTQFASVTDGLNPTWLAANATNDLCFADGLPTQTLSPAPKIRCTEANGAVRDLASSDKDGVSYFKTVSGMAPDRKGNWLIVDDSANVLRSISASGTFTTLAKDLQSPGAIATDQDGVVYLKIGQSIQKRTNDGTLTLVAGSPQVAGHQNGTGSDARFESISALAVDAQRYLYVADSSGTPTIRIISPLGQVSTLAGTLGQSGVRLGNAPGSLAPISGLAVSADQKSLLATTANGVIRITLQR